MAVVGCIHVASVADVAAKVPVYKAPVAAPLRWAGLYLVANVGSARHAQVAPRTPQRALSIPLGPEVTAEGRRWANGGDSES